MNILISSIGRRVALADCFRESLRDLSVSGSIIAIDAMLESPAGQIAERFIQVPRCTESDFVETVLQICERESIRLVVPTIDTELPVYAGAKRRFARAGVLIGVSDPTTISICEDKTKTHAWLKRNGFPTVRQSKPLDVLENQSGWALPLIVKPKAGSASVGVMKLHSFEQLEPLVLQDELIVEEMADGEEYTINVYMNREGTCISAVPHRRIEVRSGEVSKGITSKHPLLIQTGRNVAERLPGAWGPLNVQCFLNSRGDLRIIEINARFGGGYPLAHRAGATMTSWLIQEVLGTQVTEQYDAWEDELMMLRYDGAVFLSHSKLHKEANASPVSCV